jgi:hypothetical protein
VRRTINKAWRIGDGPPQIVRPGRRGAAGAARLEASCREWDCINKGSGTNPMVADVPVGGRGMVVELRVRRLRCETRGCSRQTFREQVPEVAESVGPENLGQVCDLRRYRKIMMARSA